MEIEGGGGAAIRALGSFFKLTEVYICNDGSTETREISLLPESTKSSRDLDDISFSIPASTIEISEILENEQLIKQMDALGLPISFLSNKETSNKMKKSKRKGARLKHSRSHKEAKEEALEFTQVSGLEIVCPSVLNDSTSNSLCCMSMMGQSESCFYDVAVGIDETAECPTGDSASSTKIISGAVREKNLGGTSHCLSNAGHEYESVPHNDVMSKDDDNGGQSLSNSDGAPPGVCCLTDAGANHGEKGIANRLIEYECLEESSAANHHEEGDKFCNDSGTEHLGISEPAEFSQSSEAVGHGEIDSYNYYGDFGDWRVYWDSLYMRYYFHNVKTDTCTWYPPPGMEHLASGDITDELNEATAEVTEMDGGPSFSCSSLNYHETSEGPPNDESCLNKSSDEISMEIGVATGNSMPGLTTVPANGSFEHADECLVNGSCDDEVALHLPSAVQECMDGLTSTVTEVTKESDIYLEIADPATDNLDTQLNPAIRKPKKKEKKTRVHKKSSMNSEDLQSEQMFEEFSSNIAKYWCQRYTLFSRFDDGIRMDEEGWFSVTPEPIAKHHALRCMGDTIIDCFTGVGGNAIQFAQRYKHVIAIDIDPKKIDYAFHNASIYGVSDQIDFIEGDFYALASKLKADSVFLSPPWGGPAYSKVKTYNIKTMLKPRDGFSLFNTAKQIGHRIIMFLPRNIDLNQLAELCLTSNPPWSLEVEQNFMNGKLKAITAYFSNTVIEGQ